MLRRTFRRLGSPYERCGPLSPHQVLGVNPDTPFEDVRKQFYQLTKRYHPDVEHGDPAKFREINNAYRLLRAQYRQSTGGGVAGSTTMDGGGATAGAASASSQFQRAGRRRRSSSQNTQETPTGGAFWEERNEQIRKNSEQRERERWAAEERARRQTSRKRTVFGELLYFLNGSEIAISIGTVVIVLLYSVERYHTVNRMLAERRQRLKNMDEGLPPPMPMEVDKELDNKCRERPESAELQIDALRIREESSYRRVTQRKFEDFREFMFVYDPEAIASRKVTTNRFSYQYMKESEIPKRCPIFRTFNSEDRSQAFHTIEKPLVQAIRETPWVKPDAGYAGALVAKGLGSIPINSPNTTKWTFIEYVDVDKGPKEANATCLAAIRNLRFEQTGMCQRVSVTGKSELQPELVARRAKELKEGKLNESMLVRGGALPLKDLSVPLESMKL